MPPSVEKIDLYALVRNMLSRAPSALTPCELADALGDPRAERWIAAMLSEMSACGDLPERGDAGRSTGTPLPGVGVLARLREVQRDISARVSLEDRFSLSLPGAVWFASRRRKGACALVVGHRDGAPEDILTSVNDLTFPYIPGYLAYRYLPPFEDIWCSVRPTLLLVNAHGTAHPRGAGLATHLGVVYDIPTIGVARRALVPGWPTSRGRCISPGYRISLESAVSEAASMHPLLVRARREAHRALTRHIS